MRVLSALYRHKVPSPSHATHGPLPLPEGEEKKVVLFTMFNKLPQRMEDLPGASTGGLSLSFFSFSMYLPRQLNLASRDVNRGTVPRGG